MEAELGPEFRAMVNAIAGTTPHPGRTLLPADLPNSSARLDLVRLAVIVALERAGEQFEGVPAPPRRGWPAALKAAVFKERRPGRPVTIAEDGELVRVTIGEERFEFRPPSEQECRRLLEPGARGTVLRFPVFPSHGPFLLARGHRPDEVVLWEPGAPVTEVRLPGPVLAATYVSRTGLNALIEVDGELFVHYEDDHDTIMRNLRIPIDFSVADEAERDLSPLYLHAVELWDYRVYFRRAGLWWEFSWSPGHVRLEPSNSKVHQPERFPFQTVLDGAGLSLFGPSRRTAGRRDDGWVTWGYGRDGEVIPVPPAEEVLGLTEFDDRPALLTREGAVVRARTLEDVRTVVEFDGPVLLHHGLPWVAVQRSAYLVEVIEVATGAVLHRVSTA
ncbi:hypothetical protein SK854_03110 [Lentzea sp. BCCO 10_0061]|uniref:Uncharacterized protein n=1 Tax=Lentzea sokolovensis TaxID=3095429 RepID=A0ABU4UNT2_9PSEU|nr:hypothetical protein [Lentzea sp. BCCO 10_0061]MDX8141084.1 hypothetical protein [Lentzea sp. BCCO 10_0061]